MSKLATANIRTPVLFLVFNRPAPTQQSFEAIRAGKPTKLYVAADGARNHKEGEAKLCEEVRQIATNIDWPCEVKTLFRKENLGCQQAVSGAISWFFKHEEMGIILEDDCVPGLSFFRFCQELLERYKDDTRIMHIAGSNHHKGWNWDNDYSYHFSHYGHMWGWASWKRAWDLYDVELKVFEEIKDKKMLHQLFPKKLEAKYLFRKVGEAYSGKLDTWDYQWDFIRHANSGLSIIPATNLVANIGFGEDATHTLSANDWRSTNSVGELEFPLKHPPFIIRDARSDNRHFQELSKQILLRKLYSLLRIKGYNSKG